MIRSIWSIIFLLLSFNAQGKEISLSFDDAPRRGGLIYTGLERTQQIIQELEKVKVDRAAFFVNTRKLPKGHGLERVKMYQKAGHLIGNHTHRHINIKTATTKEYLADFDKADIILKKHMLLDPFFRYPYLRRGKTFKEVNSIHQYILKKGYIDAFVTVDNFDFYMEDLFQKALQRGEKINFEHLKKFYIETLYKGVEFYDELAIKALGKKVKHVMLLHENDLAALFIGDFVKHLRSKGWKIITPEESYEDPVTKHFPKTVLDHGSGRVNALAVEASYADAIRSGLESTEVLDGLFKEYEVIISQ